MRQFLANIASRVYSRKKIVFFGLAIILLLSLVPLHIARAGLGESIINALIAYLFPLVTGVLIAIAELLRWIFVAETALLNLVITWLMSMTVTPGLDNTPDFVLEGWKFTQGLVNIIFILVLTFIGLATILRLQTYQLQKTLPSLIITALLVNFSGVFVGFFADIGNILTKAFLAQGSLGNSLFNFVFTLSPAGNAVKVLFYLVAILVLLVIILMFVVRMVMLWVLVILAPLAFAARILPNTQKYWTQWFGALVQWSLFTIPIAFFMYLAGEVLTGDKGWASSLGLFSGAFPSLVALILLFLGITLSMQMAPAGAQGVINFAKKLPKRISESRMGAKVSAGLASRTQKAFSGMEKNKYTHQLGWALNRSVGGKLIEYSASKRRLQMPKNLDQMKEPELEAYVKAQGFSNEEKVQFAARMHEKKKLKHTSDEFKKDVAAAASAASNDPYIQDDIGIINDALPEMVNKDVTVNMAMAVETDPKKKEEARLKALADILKERKTIEEDATNDPELNKEIVIQAGLRFGHITKEDVERDRDAAFATADSALNTTQKGAFLDDLAAAKKYAQELKPQDIPGVINPKTLAFRLATRDANPENLHRFVANFDKEAITNMFTGPGGLDAAVMDKSGAPSKDALIAFAKKNPRLVKALFTSSGYQHIDWAGRKILRDKYGDDGFKKFWDDVEPRTSGPSSGGSGGGTPRGGAGGPGTGAGGSTPPPTGGSTGPAGGTPPAGPAPAPGTGGSATGGGAGTGTGGGAGGPASSGSSTPTSTPTSPPAWAYNVPIPPTISQKASKLLDLSKTDFDWRITNQALTQQDEDELYKAYIELGNMPHPAEGDAYNRYAAIRNMLQQKKAAEAVAAKSRAFPGNVPGKLKRGTKRIVKETLNMPGPKITRAAGRIGIKGTTKVARAGIEGATIATKGVVQAASLGAQGVTALSAKGVRGVKRVIHSKDIKALRTLASDTQIEIQTRIDEFRSKWGEEWDEPVPRYEPFLSGREKNSDRNTIQKLYGEIQDINNQLHSLGA